MAVECTAPGTVTLMRKLFHNTTAPACRQGTSQKHTDNAFHVAGEYYCTICEQPISKYLNIKQALVSVEIRVVQYNNNSLLTPSFIQH